MKLPRTSNILISSKCEAVEATEDLWLLEMAAAKMFDMGSANKVEIDEYHINNITK